MKNLRLFVIGIILTFVSGAHARAIPFFEAQAGIIASNGSQAPTYGVRGGIEKRGWDLSIGYFGARGMSSDQLASGGLNLHVLSAEAYRVFTSCLAVKSLRFKIGGGIGYAIPNLDGGAFETADNGNSWIFGVGADYALTDSISAGLDIKGFFFTTDVHQTTFGSHDEELFIGGVDSGQSVSVTDEFHQNNVVNFNSVLATVSLRWK